MSVYFSSIDVDKDGKLTLAELRVAGGGGNGQFLMNGADADGK